MGCRPPAPGAMIPLFSATLRRHRFGHPPGPGPGGQQVTNPVATRMLYQIYPTHIKRWINRRGGLKPGMIFLRGRELAGMYKPCYMDAQARGSRTN